MGLQFWDTFSCLHQWQSLQRKYFHGFLGNYSNQSISMVAMETKLSPWFKNWRVTNPLNFVMVFSHTILCFFALCAKVMIWKCQNHQFWETCSIWRLIRNSQHPILKGSFLSKFWISQLFLSFFFLKFNCSIHKTINNPKTENMKFRSMKLAHILLFPTFNSK